MGKFLKSDDVIDIVWTMIKEQDKAGKPIYDDDTVVRFITGIHGLELYEFPDKE